MQLPIVRVAVSPEMAVKALDILIFTTVALAS